MFVSLRFGGPPALTSIPTRRSSDLALVIDGVDGSLARWARVKEQAARIDGDTLDLVVDYLTYVFIPAIFIWRAGLVPRSEEHTSELQSRLQPVCRLLLEKHVERNLV